MLTPERMFLNRFQVNRNAFALQNPSGGYFAKRDQIITDELLQRHFEGKLTLGMYSTNPTDNTCLWGCYDIDDDTQNIQADKLVQWLRSNNIYIMRESVRPGRYGHIWILCNSALPAAVFFRLGAYGKLLTGLNSEFFAKQPFLQPGQLGNLVRMPLNRHQKPSANGVWGLFYDCPSTNIQEQLLWFLDQPINTTDSILRLVNQLPDLPQPKRHEIKLNPEKLKSELPDWEWVIQPNGQWVGPCPTCLRLGFDRQRNNLSFNPTTGLLFCFRNLGEHSKKKAFKQLMQDFRLIRI